MLWFILVLVLDRLTKIWAINSLKTADAFEFIPGILEFRYAENTGIAFSLFESMPILLTVINSLIVLALIFWVYQKGYLSIGFALILGGGIGNLLDRFLYGFVIDFINPLFIDFAVFNVSDIALNIGVVFLLIESMREGSRRSARHAEAKHRRQA